MIIEKFQINYAKIWIIYLLYLNHLVYADNKAQSLNFLWHKIIKKMVGDNLTLRLNSKIDLPRLLLALVICILTYAVNHCLAFDKRADEPFIEAPNPYDEKQGWLKNQNSLLKQIWQAGPTFPTALVVIVESRGEADHTIFKAKDRLFEYRPSRGQEQESSRPKPRIKDTIFINYGWQIFHIF